MHDCEIALDKETGHVEILSYRVVQDVGLALNPRAIQGQIQGGNGSPIEFETSICQHGPDLQLFSICSAAATKIASFPKHFE